MKILFYSSKDFELPFIKNAAPGDFEITYTEAALSESTATKAAGYEGICIFAGDDASADVVSILKSVGVKYIALRSAGYDNVDLNAANAEGIHVANVPEYSPYAIAEHTIALMLALNRKIVKADQQVHAQNFTLGNLVGFDLNGKKVGLIGTGRIGKIVAKILHGFGCTVFAYDLEPDKDLEDRYNVFYTGLNTISSLCDIISVHLPLNDETRYLIDRRFIQNMKKGVMLINTSRGGVIKTSDVIDAMKSGRIAHFGLDVYEKEKGIFFYDHTGKDLQDPVLQKLMSMPNVLITPHQAYATNEALTNIADTTFENFLVWKNNKSCKNELTTFVQVSVTAA